MILSPDFPSTCIVPYPSTFIRSLGVSIQRSATNLISLKKRSLSYVRGSLHPESYMTLLLSEVDSLSTVFAKEKLPKRNSNSVGDVIVSSRILVLQILLIALKIQDVSCNRCLIWSSISLFSVQSGFLADETMYEHSSNSWISPHTHFLAPFFEWLSLLFEGLFFWSLLFWASSP